MYIPEIVCGFVLGIVVETVTLVVWAVHDVKKKKE